MKYAHAPEWDEVIRDVVKKCEMTHVDVTRVRIIRSTGTSTRRTIARIHSVPKALQVGLDMPPHYVIELISEKFDKLKPDDQLETIIHELMHIPATFGGGFRNHAAYVTNQNVKKMFRLYRENTI